ncbi:MAG: LamG domain-containing protein, partial [Verrucomicrobiae bacterium]|nr:LamG domain-containing protein [Verrucomicrobiae bacterium]
TNKLVEAVEAAVANLEPARVGFAKADAADYTALRQWIRRPDKVVEDPFGNLTVRANMHAGRNWDDATGESGPKDPDVSLVSLQSREGRPIAVLANFSMHYFGDKALSSDYFGLFSEGLKERIAAKAEGKPFVGMMSHGCSGDIWRRDYTKPDSEWNAKLTIEEYTAGLLDIALKAYEGIEYRDDADLAMAEARMTMKYRVPDKQRLEWAQRVVEAMGDRVDPKDTTEVYAREQIFFNERETTEIVVQGLRIGDIGIATTPCETYAITGLKIKAASPIKHNLVIELANGGDGYIPPPQMHRWGGYNTWPARSAGLEVEAEPKIAAAAIGLLETVAEKPRLIHELSQGPAAKAILDLKPAAWWRLDEFAGPIAEDSSGHNRDAIYETDVAYYLEGPRSDYFCENGEKNRSTMFVGGRLQGRVEDLGDTYSVSLWLWNGLPADAREVSGWIFSRGHDHGLGRVGDHLGVGGTSGHTGKLVFFTGGDPSQAVGGKTEIPRWTWQQVTLVRGGDSVKVYLNGQLEIDTKAPAGFPVGFDRFFFGGRSDSDSNWEGRLDEVTLFDRALTPDEVKRLVVE